MVMAVSWCEGVNLWSFAKCQHRGVLAEDFERKWVILRGNDEGLPAHVGPDLQRGFNRFRKRARCDRFSGARETDQRPDGTSIRAGVVEVPQTPTPASINAIAATKLILRI